MGELLSIILVFILPLAIWLLVLIDILKSEFNGSNKIIWLLVVIFLSFIGVILYLLIGRSQKIKAQQ